MWYRIVKVVFHIWYRLLQYRSSKGIVAEVCGCESLWNIGFNNIADSSPEGRGLAI